MEIFIKWQAPEKALIIMDVKEAKTLYDIIEAAVKSNKRKSTWKKMLDFFNKYMEVY